MDVSRKNALEKNAPWKIAIPGKLPPRKIALWEIDPQEICL